MLSQIGFKIPEIEFMNKGKYSLNVNEIRYSKQINYPNTIGIKNALNNIYLVSYVWNLPNLCSSTKVGTIKI